MRNSASTFFRVYSATFITLSSCFLKKNELYRVWYCRQPPPIVGDVAPLQDYRERFANRLRSLRESAGLSIEKASEQGGLSTNFWGSVERMEKEPCLDSILGFAKGVGASVRTLMTLEGEDAHDAQRKELNAILDLLRPEQLTLVLNISKLIRAYKTCGTAYPELGNRGR